VQRLSGMDAGFLYVETPTLHMHTLKVAVLGAPVGGPGTFEAMRDEIRRRLPLLPPFRRRLVEVPWGLHHPVWIEDPDFDLERHVERLVLPAPGTAGQLDDAIAEIAGRPLERDRPLWRMAIVEGLEGDRLAVVVQIHHAVADGVAASALLANVMGATEDGGHQVPIDDWRPEAVPGPARLVVDALRDQVTQLVDLPRLVQRTAGGLQAALRHRRASGVATPLPVLSSPRTSLNTSLTSERSFATTSLPLADARRVREAFGVTLNDVVLATVGGALRAYLAERGELPARALVAAVPTATAGDVVPRLAGNRVSNLFTSLATDQVDPGQRLLRVHEVTAEAKAMQDLVGSETLGDWVQYVPPRPYAWVMHQYSHRGLARRHRPPVNVVVSNVAGPGEPLYAGGARLDAIYSVGPVLEGVGLNVTVWSYLDQLHVGLLACRAMVPDAHRIADGLQEALAELVASASSVAPASAPTTT
jgi:diacylglycerol O-acyltransferase